MIRPTAIINLAPIGRLRALQVVSAKVPGEHRVVLKTNLFGDLVHLQLGVLQQLPGIFDSPSRDVAMRRYAEGARSQMIDKIWQK
jgi:hypothetical protein